MLCRAVTGIVPQSFMWLLVLAGLYAYLCATLRKRCLSDAQLLQLLSDLFGM